MRSDRPPLALALAAGAGLLFLIGPLLLIFVYAFTTEERSFVWPPPGFTLRWFAVTWDRPDVWSALGLSVKVAAISTALALVLARSARRRWPAGAFPAARRSRSW